MTDAPAPPPPPTSAPPPPQAPPPAAPPPAAGPTGGSSGNRTIMLVLSYLWILCLIPLLVEKDDGEVKWHAKHGLVLMIAEFILWIAITTLTFMLGDFLGCLAGMFSLVLWLAILVLHVVMIVQAVGGKRFTIPGVSDFVEKF